MTAYTRSDASNQDQSGERRATFIVRVWREEEENADWRGVIEHVQSGDRLAAGSLEELVSQLEHWLRRQAVE